MSDSPICKRRGRPAGSAPNAAGDDRILAAAALHIAMGRCYDLTSAVKLILDKRATPTVMRRLHRRWVHQQAQHEAAAAQTIRTMRADIDYKALKENQPELAQRVHTFASSSKGKAMLAERGVAPSVPMQLGIYTLFELIGSTDPRGASQADQFFDRAVEDWTATGVEPDVAFLNRFAERVLQRAAEIETRKPSALDSERLPEEDLGATSEGSR